MKIFLLLLLLGVSISTMSFSQTLNTLAFDTVSRKWAVDLDVSIEVTAQKISNRFFFPVMMGGKISNTIMNKLVQRQNDLNRLGMYTEPEIAVSLFDVKPFKSKPWGLKFQVGALYTASARYSGNFLSMALIGNESFLGKTIGMSNQTFQFFGGHKLGFGLVDEKTKSSVMINAVGIHSYSGGGISQGELSFSEDGDLRAQLDGRFQNAHSAAFYKGAGFSIDATFNLKLGKAEKEMYFQFAIKNLGVGFLNNRMHKYQVDSLYHYNGFTYEGIQELGDKFSDAEQLMKELGVEKREGGKAVLLPMQIHIGKLINESLTKRWQFGYGVRVYVQQGAIPLIYGVAQWRANQWLRVGGGIHYGGYGGWRGNLYVQGIWEQFVVGLNINNAVGLTPFGNGISGGLTMGYRMNKN